MVRKILKELLKPPYNFENKKDYLEKNNVKIIKKTLEVYKKDKLIVKKFNGDFEYILFLIQEWV